MGTERPVTLRDDSLPHQIRLRVGSIPMLYGARNNLLLTSCTCGATPIENAPGEHWAAYAALEHDLSRGPL